MSYEHLTSQERHTIYTLRKESFSIRAIADALSRSPSSISRELRRNSGGKGYRYQQAHSIALQRRKNSSRNTKISHRQIKYVEDKLNEEWSPEQISGTMKESGEMKNVSHEWIYQFVWRDKKNEGDLYKKLRHSLKKRKKRYGSQNSRGQIVDRKPIEDRPVVVDEKSRIGDWEIDTVMGKGNKQAVVTINERLSGFVLIGKVAKKTTEAVTRMAVELLKPYKDRVLTITADNGKEFADFKYIEKKIDTKVFFATPYSSWERGANENVNGLIRQYLPKGSCFEGVGRKQCKSIMKKLNNRPRKRLSFKFPSSVFNNSGETAALQS